jgi:peptide/nickel transport system permease protein
VSGRLPTVVSVATERAIVAETARVHRLHSGAIATAALFTGRFATGDWGAAWRDGQPVATHLKPAGTSLLRIAAAAVLAVVLALLLAGIVVIWGGIAEGVVSVLAVAGVATPVLWLCHAAVALAASPGDAAAVLVLAAAPAALLLQHLRGHLQQFLRSELATALRARGLSLRRLIFRHGLRAALPSVLPVMATTVAYVLGVAPVVERALVLDGAGNAIIAAALVGDVPVLAAFAGVTGLLVAAAMHAARALAEHLDPRERAL